MPLPVDLTDLMLDEITLEAAGALDKFNNFTFGSPVTARCYLVTANVRALDRGGREVTSTIQAILADPDMAVSINDRLTLPDGTQPAIIEVLAAKDDQGPYYLEIRA